ncbi:MAG: 2-C-methyl-D-erythritol 4-phosphate cytidylyltransferase [Gemmatimonadaceae bacterium]|nr:2-C-methyl-D-erythritol 4-phosphate cytidylyltransferase [Gemmatimonadaceae bacterium]
MSNASGAVTRDIGVVIVAAGSSSRTAGAELKQFRWVAGKPMLLHSVQRFMERADVAIVVCVLPKSHAGDPPPWLFQCDVDRLLVSVGGRERGESVLNGLGDMPPEVRFVLVHDAARPLVDGETIERVVTKAREGVGAVPALPATDTIKEVDESGAIVRTPDRTKLYHAQTPQGFPREMIEEAYVRAKSDRVQATDDAALCERIGAHVVIVAGSTTGMKVTTDEDFARVDALMKLVR